MKRPPTPHELFGQECHQGWNALIQPLCDDLQRLGGRVVQIKEKFGGLRFYYRLPRKVRKSDKEAFLRKVLKAMDASLSICETCGKPGALVNDKGYLFTACDACREARQALNR